MKFPQLSPTATSREMLSNFAGYNHNLKIRDAEFYDMRNMTSSYYPVLSPRDKRAIGEQFTNPKGLIAKDALYWIDGNTFYANGSAVQGLVLNNNTPKQLISMGAYILIFPDNIRFNTTDGTYEYLENSYSTKSGDDYSMLELSLCKADGSAISNYSQSEPEEPENGELWLDTSGEKHILKQWSESTGMWTQVATTYVKLYCAGIGTDFSKFDGVTVSGLTGAAEQFNGTQLIQAVDTNYIVIIGILDSTLKFNGGDGSVAVNAEIKVERKIPKMDFYTESENRIWGCKYGMVDGKTVNEIYACALGDPKNWNQFRGISTDSYAVSLGTDGVFTGAITHGGYPLFFKENCIHKIFGNLPSNYQVLTTNARGVQQGSEKSLVIVNERLYYKSALDVCVYDGSLPASISDALGHEHYTDAVAGDVNGKYYISMNELGETGYGRTLVNAVKKSAFGEELSVKESRELKASKYGQCVINELSSVVEGSTQNFSSTWTQSSPEVREYNRISDMPKQKVTSRVIINAPKAVKAETKAVSSADTQVKGFTQVDGKTKLKLANGETVSTKDVSFGNELSQDMYEAAAKFSAPVAKVFVNAYQQSQDVPLDTFTEAFNTAYKLGYDSGNTNTYVATARSLVGHILNDVQASSAYRAGQFQRRVDTQNRQRRINEAVSKSKANNEGKTKASENGAVRTVDTSAIDGRKLGVRQRHELAVLNKFVEAGLDISVFASDTDSKGRYVGKNGSYNHTTNKIEIDINAGIDELVDNPEIKGSMLRSFSHELTHFIQHQSPEMYETLRNAVIKVLEKRGNGTAAELAAKLQQKYKAQGIKITLDEAMDEVVAEGCEIMLRDSNAIKELARENMTLVQKIKAWIDDYLDHLKAVLRTFTARSEEAAILEGYKDDLAKIQKIWDEALKNAIRTSNATGGVVNTDGGVRYSIKNDNIYNEYANVIETIEKSDDISNKGNYIEVSSQTPTIIIENTKSENLPMAMSFETAYLETRHDGKLLGHYHNLGSENMKKIPKMLENPDYIITLENGRINVIFDMETQKGKRALVSIELSQSKQIKGSFNKYNLIITAFGAKEQYLKKIIENPNNVINYKKETETQGTDRLYKWSDGINASISNNSISNSTGIVKQKSARDTEYLKAVKANDMDTAQKLADEAAKENGYTINLFHQTDNDFTVFETKHGGAGTRDNETPFGIFMKSSSEDIGLKGKNQMKLYAKIQNPLKILNREALVYELEKMSPQYKEIKQKIKQLDVEYQEKFDNAKKAWREWIENWRKTHPNAERREAYNDAEFEKVFNEEEMLFSEQDIQIHSVGMIFRFFSENCRQTLTR